MSEQDRVRWDQRYADREPPDKADVDLPGAFRPYADVFPRAGSALDVACGRGAGAVWLALRGMTVHGVDVSPVAVRAARDLARRCGVTARCRFDAMDLDAGLPAGGLVDVLVCSMFRDRRLDAALVARLAPGGLLAVSALSEVGAVPGPFRAHAGELTDAFGALEVIACAETNGQAWLLARR